MRKRSSKRERAIRINRAVKLLKLHRAKPEVIDFLRREYGVSRPQAHRYVQEAVRLGKMLKIPEEKVSVVVKLPVSISRRIRRLKEIGKGSLGGIVTEVLTTYLKRHGQ